MNAIEKLIALAESEVGYCEKSKVAVTSNPLILNDKTNGAGDGNMTKYSRDILKWVGAPYAQGVPWCDIFVDWCFISAFGVDKAKDIIGGWSAYTPTSAQYYKNMGRWYTAPEVGDQIFFKNATRINHTGIVYKVDSTKVYTIEGNTSSNSEIVENGGCVAKKSYLLSNPRIAGYGRPKYELYSPLVPIFPNVYPQKGVDVAAWQRGIDYAAMRSMGVKFAVLKIIRKDLEPDEMFETHYKGFSEAGIPIRAVYQYSYATTVEKAKIDALRVIGILNGRKIPVALDVENDCQKKLGERLVKIINAYQEVIQNAGLPFLVYTGLYFYNTYILPYEKLLRNTQFWIARYPVSKEYSMIDNPNPIYKPNVKNLVAWQYTSNGQIKEAYNGKLDFDILYCGLIIQPKVGICTAAKSLRIRSAPNTTGKVIGYLKKDEKVNIYGKDAQTGWYRISEDQEQWASNAYIELL